MRSTFHSSRNNLIRRVDSQFSLDKDSSGQDTTRTKTPLTNKIFQQPKQQKQLIVTNENFDSPEVRRRMKFDRNVE